ncbi:MAG: substrate-binding domain-containing protein [Clostridium sp.]|nr:substrate-binding domain-containing protein [Clostridium sp.]
MKKSLAVVLAAAMAMSLAACGGNSAGNATTAAATEAPAGTTEAKADEAAADTEAESPSGQQKAYKFGFTEMSAGSFFDACYGGAEEVVKSNGGEIVHVEGKADSAYQLGVIEDFISQGCDLVFYNPSDAAASAAAVKALNDAGIPIVNFDSAVSDLSKVNCFVVSDSYSCGQIAGEELIKNHPEGGKVAVLDFPASAAAADRAKGFVDTVTADGLFEVAAQMDAGAKPEKGLTVMQDLLQAHSDLTAVFCINDECAQGAYSAITTAGEKIEIYSVNAGPEAKAAMTKDGTDGIWKCTAAQRPIEIGKQSAEVAYKILNGEEYEAEIKIPSFAVTPENIDQYNKADWQ